MQKTAQYSEESLLAEFAPSYEYYAPIRTKEESASYNDEPYGGEQSQSEKIEHVVDQMKGDPLVRMVVDQKVSDPAVRKELKLARGYLHDIGTIQSALVRKAALDSGNMKLLFDTNTWHQAYAHTPLMEYKLLGANSFTFRCKAVELSTEMLSAVAGFVVGAEAAAAKAFRGFIQELGERIRLRQEKTSSAPGLILPNSRAVYNEDTEEVEAWYNVNTIDAKHSREILKSNCASVEMVNITIETTQINGIFNLGALDRYPKVKENFGQWATDHLNADIKRQEAGFGFEDVEKKQE
jgi:5-hydroxyisourate hydrolase-like protein (transthyretin family)